MKMVLVRAPQTSPPQMLRPTESYSSFKKEMYIDIWAEIVKQMGGEGEVWYLGSKQCLTEEYDGLVLRMVPDTIWLPNDEIKVMWFRGSAPIYDVLAEKYPRAYKMYYGGGYGKVIHLPDKWNLVLVDTAEQYKLVRERAQKAQVHCWAKPASRWFEQFDTTVDEKEFHVVLCASRGTENKGLDWAAKFLPKGTQVLRVGPPDEWFENVHQLGRLDVEFTGYIPSYEVPAQVLRARVGLACDPGKFDSGPRIIPEYLSLGLPVLIRSGVHFNSTMYCSHNVASIVDEKTLCPKMKKLLNVQPYKVRDFYNAKVSLEMVAAGIVDKLVEGMGHV